MNLSNKQIGMIAGGVGAVIVALILFMNVIGIYNYGNAQEQLIMASYKKSETTLTQFTEKVQEEFQISNVYADKLKEVATATLDARYGDQGSQALFQMIKEQNPNLDASVYKKVQNDIAAGRDDFSDSQNMLNDATRQYKTSLGSFWTGMWLAHYGYPKIKLADYEIVTSLRTDRIFESKHDEVINFK